MSFSIPGIVKFTSKLPETQLNAVLRFVDPLINALLAVFVQRAGPNEGFRAFKAFLATVPIFFGVLAFALCMLLPSGDSENKDTERPVQKGDNCNNLFNFYTF